MDPFGRHIDYLRISVIDRCNERCLYCMPLAPGGPIDARHFFSVAEAMERLLETSAIDPSTDNPPGHGPARYYLLRRSGAHLGFIGSVTCTDFCATCNKLRLTAATNLISKVR